MPYKIKKLFRIQNSQFEKKKKQKIRKGTKLNSFARKTTCHKKIWIPYRNKFRIYTSKQYMDR